MKKIYIVLTVVSFNLHAVTHAPPRLSFMTEVDLETKSVVEKIIRHPFLRELANASLSKDKYDYFSRQDDMYDWRYANSLLKLASKAVEPKLKSFLVIAAQHTTQGWTTPAPNEREQCPSCRAYSDFEAVAVTESFSGGLAAIAPCYVIYETVGVWLKQNSVPKNPYQSFIDAYSAPKFLRHVAEMKGTLNSVAAQEGDFERKEMLLNYANAVDYEWQFWNSAYQLTPKQPAGQDQ